MKPKKQKYIVVKHVIATSVEDAIKRQDKFQVVFCNPEMPQAQAPREVGFIA